MSSNAVALRRIICSIGTIATPSRYLIEGSSIDRTQNAGHLRLAGQKTSKVCSPLRGRCRCHPISALACQRSAQPVIREQRRFYGKGEPFEAGSGCRGAARSVSEGRTLMQNARSISDDYTGAPRCYAANSKDAHHGLYHGLRRNADRPVQRGSGETEAPGTEQRGQKRASAARTTSQDESKTQGEAPSGSGPVRRVLCGSITLPDTTVVSEFELMAQPQLEAASEEASSPQVHRNSQSGENSDTAKASAAGIHATPETRSPTGDQPINLQSRPSHTEAAMSGFGAPVAQAVKRLRDGHPLGALKPLGTTYWRALASSDNTMMKSRITRARIESSTHAINESFAWRHILRMLTNDTLNDGSQYAKRMDTVMMPEGIFVRWKDDPRESILQIMQNTGSHIQGIHTGGDPDMSGLTMFGTPAQNNAAARYLLDTDLLYARSDTSINVPRSISNHKIYKGVSDIHGNFVTEDNAGKGVSSVNGASRSEEETERRNGAIEHTASKVTHYVPTRAVWSRSWTVPDRLQPSLLSPIGPATLSQYLETSKCPAPTTAISFTARIRTLTAYRPRLLRQKRSTKATAEPNHTFAIEVELVHLFVTGFESGLVTTEALSIALGWLARHSCIPSVRKILAAADERDFPLNATVFDALLKLASKASSVNNFRYFLLSMTRRGLRPTALTWVHFENLTLLHFPDRLEDVRDAMREGGVHRDHTARLESFRNDLPGLLTSYLLRHPHATVPEFWPACRVAYPNFNRLGPRTANIMIETALRLGKTDFALEVVDELTWQGSYPTTVMLESFLLAARRQRSMELAVAILVKFHKLQSASIPVIEPPGPQLPGADSLGVATQAEMKKYPHLPTVFNHPVKLSASSFRWLMWIAWNRKHWNCFRVFWRYACLAGHVNDEFIRRMKFSLTVGHGSRWDPSHLDWPVEAQVMSEVKKGRSNDRNNMPSTRSQIWYLWVARFAMGVRDGLSPAPWSSFRADSREARPQRLQDYLYRLNEDFSEVQSLQPIRPLARMAEEAFQLDRKWLALGLGNRRGLAEEDWGEEGMFARMMREGIEIPVEVGNAVGMSV